MSSDLIYINSQDNPNLENWANQYFADVHENINKYMFNISPEFRPGNMHKSHLAMFMLYQGGGRDSCLDYMTKCLLRVQRGILPSVGVSHQETLVDRTMTI